nr:hypothetical protein CFP56_25844 [Quercus suber]
MTFMQLYVTIRARLQTVGEDSKRYPEISLCSGVSNNTRRFVFHRWSDPSPTFGTFFLESWSDGRERPDRPSYTFDLDPTCPSLAMRHCPVLVCVKIMSHPRHAFRSAYQLVLARALRWERRRTIPSDYCPAMRYRSPGWRPRPRLITAVQLEVDEWSRHTSANCNGTSIAYVRNGDRAQAILREEGQPSKIAAVPGGTSGLLTSAAFSRVASTYMLGWKQPENVKADEQH